jgi:hypothetical protein
VRYVEFKVEAVSEPAEQPAGAAGSDGFLAGEEVAYNHYSGCTIAAFDVSSRPPTCSVHVPGVGTREHVPVSQLRSLRRTAAAADERQSEMEQRMTIEISMLKDRLAADAAAAEGDPDASGEMRAVFERRYAQSNAPCSAALHTAARASQGLLGCFCRIRMLQEEMLSRRRRASERPAIARVAANRGLPASQQLGLGLVSSFGPVGALRALGVEPVDVRDPPLRDGGWVLRGTRVSKPTAEAEAVVSRAYPAFLDSLNAGDRVGVRLDTEGQLSFHLNGNDLGVAASRLPVADAYHVLLELRGHVEAVRLLPEMTAPKTQTDLEKDLLVGLVKAGDVTAVAIAAKISEDAASVELVDKHGRVPLHHLCENEFASVGTLRVLVDAAPAAVLQRDGADNTPLLCMLKRTDAGLNKGGTVVHCQRGHVLEPDVRRLNYCDVCRATGTKYRCGGGCDYDMCENCFSAKAAKAKASSTGPPAAVRSALDMLHFLIGCEPSLLALRDRGGKLPVQVAEELGLSRDVREYLLEATVEAGAIWCGAPSAGEGQFGVHLLSHLFGAGDGDPESKNVRFDVAFRGLATNEVGATVALSSALMSRRPFSPDSDDNRSRRTRRAPPG